MAALLHANTVNTGRGTVASFPQANKSHLHLRERSAVRGDIRQEGEANKTKETALGKRELKVLKQSSFLSFTHSLKNNNNNTYSHSTLSQALCYQVIAEDEIVKILPLRDLILQGRKTINIYADTGIHTEAKNYRHSSSGMIYIKS